MNINAQINAFNELLNDLIIKKTEHKSTLIDAMRYACLQSGKRLRPLLVYATGDALNIHNKAALDYIACSVELTHTYSLIHDDLPAMDDDHLRRGQPSCHIQFNEATAILAGDALQTLAFEVLSDNIHTDLPAENHLKMIKLLAQACGAQGMAEGQAQDMILHKTEEIPDFFYPSGKKLQDESPVEAINQMHLLKTGKLIQASIIMTTLASSTPIDKQTIHLLERFGHHLGLAFQIQDDILDITQTTEELGKPQGSDIEANKKTYPSILGLKNSERMMNYQYKQCEDMVKTLNTSSVLNNILGQLKSRTK